jgi:hypothetical protein
MLLLLRMTSLNYTHCYVVEGVDGAGGCGRRIGSYHCRNVILLAKPVRPGCPYQAADKLCSSNSYPSLNDAQKRKATDKFKEHRAAIPGTRRQRSTTGLCHHRHHSSHPGQAETGCMQTRRDRKLVMSVRSDYRKVLRMSATLRPDCDTRQLVGPLECSTCRDGVAFLKTRTSVCRCRPVT